jgi:hypothetical protein
MGYEVSWSYLFNAYRLELIKNAQMEEGKVYIFMTEQCSQSGGGRFASCYPKINVNSGRGCATQMLTENARPQSAFTLLLSLMGELSAHEHRVQSLNEV